MRRGRENARGLQPELHAAGSKGARRAGREKHRRFAAAFPPKLQPAVPLTPISGFKYNAAAPQNHKETDMAELKGSTTERNLMTAFAGESQAHTKYQYYASKAE